MSSNVYLKRALKTFTQKKRGEQMTKPPINQAYQLLAVDDNELNLGLFRLLLTQQGHHVTSVNNPFDAIELVKQQAFDLVFTDIQMPGMTGIEASTKMRENGFTGPIIAITAHLSNIEELEIESSDVNDVLFKPVTKSDLDRVIQQWLEGGTPQHLDAKHQMLLDAQSKAGTPLAAAKLYDLDIALARANDSPELATEMLHLLIESLVDTMGELSGLDNPEALAQQLHKLAGGVRFTGATLLEVELEQLRQLVQQVAYNETHIEAFKKSIQDLTEWALEHPTPFD
jgi:two-component system sensor histidine kinase BarA